MSSLLLLPSPVIAATESAGSSPSAAIVLEEGENIGYLASGEAVWYVYEPYQRSDTTEQAGSLTLIFTPAIALGASVSGVNFEIFSIGQVIGEQDIATVPPIGMGGYVSRDGDPNTAELLWRGNLPVSATYYVRVYNDTAIRIDYWLFTADVISYELGGDTTEAAPAGPTPAAPPIVPPAETVTGRLEVGQEQWYTFIPSDAGQNGGESGHKFTLFFTPRYGPSGDHVTLEIMTAHQLLLRQYGQTYLNTGAGAIVSRDGDPVTGERLWSGHLMNGEAYLVRIFNGSNVPVDFWLFPADVEHADLGTAPLPLPVSGGATTENPEGSATRWGNWHVSVTCVTHCDQ